VTVLMQLDAEIGKEGLTRRGHYPAVLTEQDISTLDERIGQRHAEPPGQDGRSRCGRDAAPRCRASAADCAAQVPPRQPP
jgi:hypothetical protein